MLCAMDLAQFRYLAIHEILTGHIERTREVIYFLILVERIKNGFLDGTNRPENGPTAIVELVILAISFLLDTAESVVFHRVPNNLDVTIVEVEIITTILGLVRSYCNWILIWTKH